MLKSLFQHEVSDETTGKRSWTSELPSPKVDSCIPAELDAQRLAARVQRAGRARVAKVVTKPSTTNPPQLFDLSALQQEANRLWGFSAKETLQVAQELYAKHKVLSYPRTDSRFLDEDTAKTVSEIFSEVGAPFASLLPERAGSMDAPNPRFVDSARVGDHHALIPTGRTPVGLSDKEPRVYDLVVRRFCGMWALPLVVNKTRAELVVVDEEGEMRFVVTGSVVIQEGFRALEVRGSDEPTASQAGEGEVADLVEGAELAVSDVQVLHKTKNPPPAFTEGSLLRAMETAGRGVRDPEQAAAMKERGLGTPATRAAILETLLERGYLKRKGKTLRATPRGEALIERVRPELHDPQLTGLWEQRLLRVEQGRETLEAFLSDVQEFVREVVQSEIAAAEASGLPVTGAGR